jgi:pimeloyl-ACP methyl ester carboxylesterase
MSRTNVLSTTGPEVILVHGALTDASVWADVAHQLIADGRRVQAPALPMRGLAEDAAYLAGVLTRSPAPVVLVAHSYAGAVVSHPLIAATGKVAALVYIAAFQPDAGECAGELNEKFPGSLLTPDNLLVTANPLGGDDLTLRPDRFAEVYAADLDPARADVLAVSQRPVEPAALGEQLPGEPAWRTIPSWALVSTSDRSLPPEILRYMAERAGSHVVEVDSSHAAPLAVPAAVTELIRTAITAIS